MLVVDRSIEPRHSRTASVPLACPTYETRYLVLAALARLVSIYVHTTKVHRN